MLLQFREDLARQYRDELDRRMRTAHQLDESKDPRSVEPRRLRRRALAGGLRGWGSALTLLYPRDKRTA